MAEEIKRKIASAGFNRYIVECKSVNVYCTCSRVDRFNRYIVECKSSMIVALKYIQLEI